MTNMNSTQDQRLSYWLYLVEGTPVVIGPCVLNCSQKITFISKFYLTPILVDKEQSGSPGPF